MSDVIDSLAVIYRTQKSSDMTGISNEFEMMRMCVEFRNGMNSAANILKDHQNSKNKVIKESAEIYFMIYSGIADNENNVIKYLEDFYNNPRKAVANPGTQAAKFAEIEAITNNYWKGLAENTVYSLYSIIDSNRIHKGKLICLNISKAERKLLIDKLDMNFGKKIKGGLKVGQKPVHASASLLYEFLAKSKWKSADEK